MTKIILNEIAYAEKILSGKEPCPNTFFALNLMARYYCQAAAMKPGEAFQALNNFLLSHVPDYNPDRWEAALEKAIRNSKRYALRNIDSVGITRRELDNIGSLGDLSLRKLAFAMLCHAKFHNMISPQNHNWVNAEISELFQTARVSTRTRKARNEIIGSFCTRQTLEGEPFVTLSRKNTNTNVRYTPVDMEGAPVLHITDFRELGYEYLLYEGLEQFTRCQRCGVMVKKGKRQQKYCSQCAKLANQEKTRQRMRQLRSKNV